MPGTMARHGAPPPGARPPRRELRHDRAGLWRYAGGLGRVWRLHGFHAPHHIKELHTNLLLALRDELLPHLGHGSAAQGLLRLLSGLASRPLSGFQGEDLSDLHKCSSGDDGGFLAEPCSGGGPALLGPNCEKKVVNLQGDDSDLLTAGGGGPVPLGPFSVTKEDHMPTIQGDDSGLLEAGGGGPGPSGLYSETNKRTDNEPNKGDDTGPPLEAGSGGPGPSSPLSETNKPKLYKPDTKGDDSDLLCAAGGGGPGLQGLPSEKPFNYSKLCADGYVCDYRSKPRRPPEVVAIHQLFQDYLDNYDTKAARRRRRRCKGPG